MMARPEMNEAGEAATSTGFCDLASGDRKDHSATPHRRQLVLPLPSARAAMAGLMVGGAILAFAIGALAGARSVECDCTTVRWDFAGGRP